MFFKVLLLWFSLLAGIGWPSCTVKERETVRYLLNSKKDKSIWKFDRTQNCRGSVLCHIRVCAIDCEHEEKIWESPSFLNFHFFILFSFARIQSHNSSSSLSRFARIDVKQSRGHWVRCQCCVQTSEVTNWRSVALKSLRRERNKHRGHLWDNLHQGTSTAGEISFQNVHLQNKGYQKRLMSSEWNGQNVIRVSMFRNSSTIQVKLPRGFLSRQMSCILDGISRKQSK